MPLSDLVQLNTITTSTSNPAREVQNAKRRLESVGGYEPPNKILTGLTNAFQFLRRPSSAVNNALRELLAPNTGETPGQFDPIQALGRGWNLTEDVQGKELLQSVGISDKPVASMNLPDWLPIFGGAEVAPNAAGFLGGLLDIIHPADPLNWIVPGVTKLADKALLEGSPLLVKAFGDDAAARIVAALGKKADRMTADTVGELVSKLQKKGGKTVVDIIRDLDINPNTVLQPKTPKALNIGIKLPYAARTDTLASFNIPGSPQLLDVIGRVGQWASDTAPGQAFGRAFQPEGFAPKTVPNRVWRNILGQSGDKVEMTMGAADAYADVKKLLSHMNSGAKIKAADFGATVDKLFNALTDEERNLVRRAVTHSEVVPKHLQDAVDLFTKTMKDIPEQYAARGYTELKKNMLESYFPFISEKPLTRAEADYLRGILGTDISDVGTDAITQILSKQDPNLKKRMTQAVDPAEVNTLIGRKWLSEDPQKVLKVRMTNAYKGFAQLDALQSMLQDYGKRLTSFVDDAAKIPKGYLQVEVKPTVSGQTLLEAATKDSKNVFIIPTEFAKMYNDSAKLMFDKSDGFLGLIDKATNIYKRWAYLYNPRHFGRDLASDMERAWYADLNTLKPYVDAANWKPESAFKFAEWSGDGATLEKAARELGVIGESMLHAELGPTASLGSKLSRAFGSATQSVNDFTRRALFLDRLQKGDTLENAALVVKKYLFDYSNLTPFEQRVMKRLIPFYSYMRFNVPLMVDTLLTNPAKMSKFAHLWSALGEDAEPGKAPEFLVKGGAIRTGDSYVVPSLSMSDLSKIPTSGEGVRELLSNINPLLRIPLEMVTNQSMYTGRPLENYQGETDTLPLANLLKALTGVELPQVSKRYTGYAVNQIPQLRDIGILADPENPRRLTKLLTLIGGMPQYPAEWAERTAAYEERDRLRALIRKLEARGAQVPTVRELEDLQKLRKALSPLRKRR